MRNFYFLLLFNIFLLISCAGNKNIKNNLKNNINKLESSSDSESILIGLDNYSNQNKGISFNAVVLYNKVDEAKDNINIPLSVFYSDGTKTQDISVKCGNSSVLNKITEYSCSSSVTSNDISRVQLNSNQTNFTLSTQAQSVKNDISTEKNQIISGREMNILEDAEIVKKLPSSFVIRGNKDGLSNNYIPKSENIQLITSDNDKLSCEGEWNTDIKDEDYYYLNCKTYSNINTDLNNAYGYYADHNDQGLFIKFSNPNQTTLDYNYRKNIINARKSSGLSTGGIIGILIPTIIVLLAVVGLVIAIRRRAPPPLLKDLNNNTPGVIGVGSSQTVV